MSNAATPPLHIGDTFGKGFESFLNNAVPMVLGLLILIFLGGFSLGICAPPLVVGYCKMHLRIARGETVQAGEIFDGFQFFLEAWLLALAIFGLYIHQLTCGQEGRCLEGLRNHGTAMEQVAEHGGIHPLFLHAWPQYALGRWQT